MLALVAAVAFDYGRRGPQLGVDHAWAASIGLRFHLGVDGISLPLIVLTAALTFLCMVYTARVLPAGRGAGTPSPRALVGLILLLEVGMLGTFVSLDLVLFFVFFEVVLDPDVLRHRALGRRPATRRAARAAANKFILYTLLGSGFLLVGILLIGGQRPHLDITALATRHGAGLSHNVQLAAFALVGARVRGQDADVAAAHLAAGRPHRGADGRLGAARRRAAEDGHVRLRPHRGAGRARGRADAARRGSACWPSSGIVYGALACLAQRDLKRMIAYSSIGHMGFVLLGIATLTPVGLNAALFANVAHGLITGLLFFLAGAIKERYGTGDLDALGGGMLAKAPYLASILTFAAIA